MTKRLILDEKLGLSVRPPMNSATMFLMAFILFYIGSNLINPKCFRGGQVFLSEIR